MKIIEPNSSAEFEQYYNLRYEVLRKPWLQPKGSEKDDDDKSSIHRMIIDESNGKAVAVGRLQFNTNEEAQIRYMAVSDNYQLKGYGNLIVKTLEDIALNKGIRNIILQARENPAESYNGLFSVGKQINAKPCIMYMMKIPMSPVLMRK